MQNHNGWTNWDTWESFNMLTSFERIYCQALTATNDHELILLIQDALNQCKVSKRHIEYSEINFSELKQALK